MMAIDSHNGTEVSFDRVFVPALDWRRPKWPKPVRRLRDFLPEYLISAAPSRLSEKGNWFVIAYSPKTAVGYAWTVRSLIEGDAYIEEVTVRPEFRRQGLGGKLVVETAKWVRQSGFRSISLLPINSDAWVKRLGMEKTDSGYQSEIVDLLRFPR
jgi:N-acetylglutamate synthase-like GNAT family acetyltransferase